MLYAKVVFGLPVDGPFDYIVPCDLIKKIKVGARIRVNFCNREIIGYCVGLTTKTNIKNLKIISGLIDNFGILDKNMLLLTKSLSDYYCCSWGQAIETALPTALRRGKRIPDISQTQRVTYKDNPDRILLHDLDGRAKWDIYLSHIKEAIDNKKSVIVLVPDSDALFKAKEKINFCLKVATGVLHRKQKNELEEWLNIKKGLIDVVIATRSGVFAPFNNLGLIIIDEERDPVYKQDQVPHYNAREAAFMRADIERTKLVLGATSVSLESFYLMKKKKLKYVFIPRVGSFPEIKIIDTRINRRLRHKHIFSKYLQDSITSALNSKNKILLFLNRKGFATSAVCSNCAAVLKCPRCSINLVYHFKENSLGCRYCNFKMPAPRICPNCNSGYIRYTGTGTEKIESELNRLFPQAKIKLWEKNEPDALKNADIFVSTELVIRNDGYNFDLVGVLLIDNSLNRVDFRSSEKTFSILTGLLRLTQGKLIVETTLPNHYCFSSLLNKNIDVFYEEELKQRKQLNFPPYRHMGLVKLRGEKDIKVKEISESLFDKLGKADKRDIETLYVTKASPSKLRGKYCWQILIKLKSCTKASKLLKMYLKDFLRSGTIVTVDIDPI